MSCWKEPGTTTTAIKPTVTQPTNGPESWHWDQAKADALREKANRDHDVAAFQAYSDMLIEKRMHEAPEQPLPNFASGPGLPRPMGVNFYERDEHYPGYIVCSYDVSEEHYDQSNEGAWFKAAILQIRGVGERRFPPVRWFAIVIWNRAEMKTPNTVEQSYKVGAVFDAREVFDPNQDPTKLISAAQLDRRPLVYEPGSGGQQPQWMILKQHAANHP